MSEMKTRANEGKGSQDQIKSKALPSNAFLPTLFMLNQLIKVYLEKFEKLNDKRKSNRRNPNQATY